MLEWLDDEGINPTIKVKKGRKHESSKAYSDRAIVELLVNMLVHRDYEVGKGVRHRSVGQPLDPLLQSGRALADGKR